MQLLSESKSFEGALRRYQHSAVSTRCEMNFAVYLPPSALRGARVPVLYWLSGLTCTEENFMHKAGAQRIAAELEIALVCPDTSPRGPGVATSADGHWALGLGAGFYLNATQAPWAQHYQMYDYVCQELPALIERELPVTSVRSICGHSMGGHGALTIAMKNPGRYRSVSALAPICRPSESNWGRQAFGAMLGSQQSTWHAYDAVSLIANLNERLPILIDQGTLDESLPSLRPELLEQAAREAGHPITLNYRQGYDHGYYFVASFIENHLRYHARALSERAYSDSGSNRQPGVD
jgi:S-formylglutathione hydrolase